MNFAPRVLLIVVLVAAGFMLPILWLGAACVALTLLADSRPVKVRMEDGKFPSTTVEDADWHSKMQECVESPAEEAFLNLMIEHFELKPLDRALTGSGLTLRMQVEALRYRLDFLVDDALVVEIDGAQWHSSPEAVARDKKRDKELGEAGYTILRIPAKIVLYKREKALDLVNEMRQRASEGRKQFNDARRSDLRHALKPTTVIKTAAELATNAARLMEDWNAHMERSLAEQEAREVDPDQLRALMDEVHAVIAKINIEASVLLTSQITASQEYARSINVSLQSISDPEKPPKTRSAAAGRLNSVKELLAGLEKMIRLDAELTSDPELRKTYEELDLDWDGLNAKKT